METVIRQYLEELVLGEVQRFHAMAVIPLFAPGNGGPAYLTLRDALERKLLVISEVSPGGNVPELMAKNNADVPVLLLDGEELAGAKQNRVLNTTILLKEKSETKIPVSCTEQGRWSYRTDHFYDSEVIMARKARARKYETVTETLRYSQSYRGNQGEVWDDICDMHREAGIDSETGAMKDVYEAKRATLEEYLGAFPVVPGQKGLLVMVNNTIAGLDIVSREEAYATIHPKFIKSYAIDAPFAEETPGDAGTDRAKLAQKGKRFLGDIMKCTEEKYPSIGHGWDHRLQGLSVVGSALVAFDTVIHMAFFKTAGGTKTGTMAGFSRRRGFRTPA